MKSLGMPGVSVCVALLVGGCGGGDSSPGSTAASTENPAAPADILTKVEGPPPKVEARKGPPPKKLEITDLRKGSGVAAKPGDELTVQNVAVYYTTGALLESSWAEGGNTFNFTLDPESVNQGWVRGLPGMRVGGRRELIVPTKMTYLNRPVPPGVGSEGTLIYVIDLLEARPPGATTPATTRERAEPKLEVPNGPPPKRLIVKDIEPGTGPAAKNGDELVINYVPLYYETGKPLSPGSWGFHGARTFTLGAGELLLGWERGLKGMRAGGRRQLLVPPQLTLPGYTSPSPTNGAKSLAYIVDLLEVKSKSS